MPGTTLGRKYRRLVKRSGVKKYGRALYKATGLVNPVKKGRLSTTRLFKDVKYLKSVLNPEKKTFQITVTDDLVGQCNGNLSAEFARDITPIPAQGTTSVTRNGNSLRLHSTYIKFQFQPQSTNGFPMKFRVMVCKVIGAPVSNVVADFTPRYFKPNPFIGGGTIYDYNSDRREDTFKDLRIIRSAVVTVPPGQHSGQTQLKNAALGIKWKSHHVKFTNDGSQAVSDGQIVLLILADVGNKSASTNSTLTGTAVLGINTASFVSYEMTHYFYDN